MTAERTPKETLEALRRMAAEDDAREAAELDRIEAMSDAEVEAHLRQKGADLRAIDAKADEIYRKIHPTNGAGADVPVRSNVRRFPLRAVLIAAALVVACAAAAAARHRIARFFSHLDRDEQFAPPNDFTPAQIASRLVDDAIAACRAKKWDECRDLLDDADKRDRGIERDPRYVRVEWALENYPTDPSLPWVDKAIGPGRVPPPAPAASGEKELKAPR